MKQGANTLHTMTGLLLLLLFCMAMVFSIVSGAQAYSAISRTAKVQYGERTALAYISAKIKSYDTYGGISLTDFEGTPALELKEEIDGDAYVTYIYSYEGSIWELFTVEDSGMEPMDGLEIIKDTELEFALTRGNLLELTCYALFEQGGRSLGGSMFISIQSGGELS